MTSSPGPNGDLAAFRKEYRLHRLSEEDVDRDPLRQFSRWFEEATAAGEAEPNAMTLATVRPNGRPSARTVLLKGVDGGGCVFFTNTRSRKGEDLAGNSGAALVFFWPTLERQVRIEGTARAVTRAESQAYFSTRPRESQIGAWASEQSSVITSREALELSFRTKAREFSDGKIPLPDHWGGYRLLPDRVEFWQGRENRLHDRILYVLEGQAWTIQRLSP